MCWVWMIRLKAHDFDTRRPADRPNGTENMELSQGYHKNIPFHIYSISKATLSTDWNHRDARGK